MPKITNKWLRRQLATATLVLMACVVFMITTGVPLLQASQRVGATSVQGKNGIVASANRYATGAGIEILKAGGNAIDAAVATAAALGVADPFEAGIGGGGFMMIYRKSDNRVITIDGRETAPQSAKIDMFKDPDSPAGKNLPLIPNRVSNGAAVGVPGTLLTWTEALNRYGTMPLAKVLAPAIALSEKGFIATPTYIRFLKQNAERFTAFTATRALFFKAGKVPVVGSRVTNPELGKTYRLIAQKGSNVFYRGEIGKAIVATVQRPPTVKSPPFRVISGGMTLADLDAYDVRVRQPVTSTYRGYKLYGMGLPSSGGITTIQALNLAEGYNLSQIERAQALHYLLESERLAYADRSAYLGDREFVDVPVSGLTSKAYAKNRRGLIQAGAPAPEQEQVKPGNPFPYQQDLSPSHTGSNPTAIKLNNTEGFSTAHLTVADKFGNVVAYTLTIEQTGGSGMVVPGYGFLLNNELTDFNLDSPNPNIPEPGKRPLSSMAPTILVAPDGRVLAFGSPGGSTIITTVLGIATNLIDFQMPLNQAIAAPRLSQRNNGSTEVDQGFEKTSTGRALAALGYPLKPVAEIGAATGVIVNPNGTMSAAAEPVRRGGGSATVVTPTAR